MCKISFSQEAINNGKLQISQGQTHKSVLLILFFFWNCQLPIKGHLQKQKLYLLFLYLIQLIEPCCI